METELKLRFVQADDQQRFLDDPWVQRLILPYSQRIVEMKSNYYDTKNRDLANRQLTLRIRQEGDVHVITIKGGDKSTSELHQRQEWSVVAEDWDEDLSEGLDTHWFRQSATSNGDPDDQLRQALRLLDKKPLFELCQANFTRMAFDVGFGDTLMELALDSGILSAGGLEEPVNELELELKEGDVRDLVELGQELQAHWPLAPEFKSKFARCMALLRRQDKALNGR